MFGVVPYIFELPKFPITADQYQKMEKQREVALFACRGLNQVVDDLMKLRLCHLYHKFAGDWKKIGMLPAVKFGPLLAPADSAKALEQIKKTSEAYAQTKKASGKSRYPRRSSGSKRSSRQGRDKDSKSWRNFRSGRKGKPPNRNQKRKSDSKKKASSSK